MAIKCGIAHRITHEMAETCGKQSVGRGGSMQEPRWWAAVDSNHLPPRYQHGALPVELAARQNPATARAGGKKRVYWVARFYKSRDDDWPDQRTRPAAGGMNANSVRSRSAGRRSPPARPPDPP